MSEQGTRRGEGATSADREADRYNYRHFGIPEDGHVERGVGAGEQAPDATLSTLDGEPVTLSELWHDRPAVVEFGSITCPVFTHTIERMNELARRYGDRVNFAVVYTREAHPGQDVPAHRSIEEKRANAAAARREEGIERTVLVDSLEGTTHRAYTAMPNAAYVVGSDGVVAHRADWLEPQRVRETLDALLAADGRGAEVTPTSLEDNYQPPRGSLLPEFYRAFKRAGPGSLRDFLLTLPRMARLRAKRRLEGRRR